MSLFLTTLINFLRNNLWIIPFYIVAIWLIILSWMKVNVIETILIFSIIMIANTFFIMMSSYFSNGDEKMWWLMFSVANTLYAITGIYSAINYDLWLYVTNLFIYIPVQAAMLYNIYRVKEWSDFEISKIQMIILNILYLVSTFILPTPISMIWATITATISSFALILKDKKTKIYRNLMLLAQILMIWSSVINIAINYIQNQPISWLNFAYIVFPITIMIWLLKNKVAN